MDEHPKADGRGSWGAARMVPRDQDLATAEDWL